MTKTPTPFGPPIFAADAERRSTPNAGTRASPQTIPDAAREHGLHLIIGAEFHLDGELLLVLLAPDRRAYAELSGLITLARRRSPKGEYALGLRDFAPGLILPYTGFALPLALWRRTFSRRTRTVKGSSATRSLTTSRR